MASLLEKINSPADIRSLSFEALNGLAEEIRSYIVNHVATKGGHLASNLGTVELTLAIHKIFNTPDDKLIWDVGHQAYPHKLITGRYKNFGSLKTYGGISGFLKRSESEFDCFGAGHASTSIAAGMGFARAIMHQKKSDHVISVIGDGSLTGGMAYEALNNAGVNDARFTIVLNDNTMSIAPNVGALRKYLNKIILNPHYNKFKEDVWDFTGKFSGLGQRLRELVQKVDEGVKHMVLPGGFFEDIGIRYFGPINGHDIEELIKTFESVKKLNKPCLVHVITEKGHGWELSQDDSYKWHASTPFDVNSGVRKSNPKTPPTYAQVFGQALLEHARKDEKIVAITAAMPDGVSVDIMQKEIPDRVYDVGIAEQYAVTFAGGLACEGMIPVCAIYSTFLQRAIDQVIHDIAIQNLNVIFAMSHSGLVGADGPTHHGTMDLTYMRMIPNLVIMAPSDEYELRNMFQTALEYKKGPIAFRFPKGSVTGDDKNLPVESLEIGQPRTILEGEDILILSVGHMLTYALNAAEKLQKEGHHPTVVDVRFVKPLDKQTYQQLFQKHSAVITVEDNVITGGFGSGVSELLAELNIFNLPIKHIGIPDEFVTHGDIKTLHKLCKMDAEAIYLAAQNLIKTVQTSKLV